MKPVSDFCRTCWLMFSHGSGRIDEEVENLYSTWELLSAEAGRLSCFHVLLFQFSKSSEDQSWSVSDILFELCQIIVITLWSQSNLFFSFYWHHGLSLQGMLHSLLSLSLSPVQLATHQRNQWRSDRIINLHKLHVPRPPNICISINSMISTCYLHPVPSTRFSAGGFCHFYSLCTRACHLPGSPADWTGRCHSGRIVPEQYGIICNWSV